MDILFLGFAIAIIVVFVGLKVFPDITTFAFFGSLGAFIAIGAVAVLGPVVIANGYAALIILAGAGLCSILGLRSYRGHMARKWAHLYDGMSTFERSMRRDEARYQRRMKQACPDTYTPGKPGPRTRQFVPASWGIYTDWTKQAMDGSKHVVLYTADDGPVEIPAEWFKKVDHAEKD